MEQTATVAESSGEKRRGGESRLLAWDPYLGPGFLLAVATLFIGFTCIAPEADRRFSRLEDGVQTLQENQAVLRESVARLEEGQKSLRADVNQLEEGQKNLRADVNRLEQNQQRIIEKVDAIFEVVSER